jgi:hypothetical protein
MVSKCADQRSETTVVICAPKTTVKNERSRVLVLARCLRDPELVDVW